MRHVDTLSTIYRHIFHSKLPKKSLFVEKNGPKLVLYYLENSKLPTKSSLMEEKTVKIGTILSRKSSKDAFRLGHVQC